MVRPVKTSSSAVDLAAGAHAIPVAARPGSRCARIRRCRPRARRRSATCRRRSRPPWACPGDRLGHAVGEVHDVVGRHLGELVGDPGLRARTACCLPVGALVVVVGAQEIVHALRRMPHVRVGRPRRVVPLVMLARPRQRGELVMDVGAGAVGAAARRAVSNGSAAGRRTARSSAPPSGRRPAASARTRPRPASRNRGRRPPRRAMAEREDQRRAHRAPGSASGTARGRRRSRPSQPVVRP